MFLVVREVARCDPDEGEVTLSTFWKRNIRSETIPSSHGIFQFIEESLSSFAAFLRPRCSSCILFDSRAVEAGDTPVYKDASPPGYSNSSFSSTTAVYSPKISWVHT